MYLQQLAMFPDMAKPEHYDEAALPMDLEDTEALMLDLATILPPEASPPHSPSPIFELDELLKLRAQEVLPDPDDDLLMDMLPPTPSDSGASSSPSYAPSTPASIYSDSSNDPEWSPEPQPGPSKTRRKPYTRTKQPANRAERKKVQNKNAATRYRCKKKVEEDELLQIEADLAEKNRQLREKVSEAEVEMRIVKDLLRKKFQRMGLLK
jgi:Basic region leucine zipper